MLKSLLIALAWAYLSFLGGLSPAHAYTDAEITEFERVRDIRVGIENYLHKEIYPPRRYRSSTVTNEANFHGELDQKVEVCLEKKACSVKLAFSKNPIAWQLASEFLMKAVEEILAICQQHDFTPDNIKVTLFTERTTLVGTGTYTRNANMFRVIPPTNTPRKTK